ncbi:MAG TPA: ribosome-associated translation inhibitor RaiA [Planctomycetes bacterium]|nr:ribosome-associated translation inhibitor RaiA [Planctomycetota bacterium]
MKMEGDGVKVEITARNDGVSERAREYAEKKISKMSRFFERITSARVVLESEGDRHKAEMVLSAGGGATLVGEATDTESLYAAIDTAVDKLERQVKKHKEKLVERNRKRPR